MSALQKIVVFQGAFDRVFDIIAEEGLSDGSIIVDDAISLAITLLTDNPSNMSSFRETRYGMVWYGIQLQPVLNVCPVFE